MPTTKMSVLVVRIFTAASITAAVTYVAISSRASKEHTNPRQHSIEEHTKTTFRAAAGSPKPATSVEILSEAKDRKPSSGAQLRGTQPVAVLLAEARDAMGRKAFDKARESLQAAFAVTTDPDKRMEVGQMLYECLIRTQAYEAALALGRELLTLSPSPEERLTLNRQLAALLHKMGKPEEAEALLTQAMAMEQDPAARAKYEAQLRGVWRHTPGRTDEVVSNLTQRIAANPQDETALRQLGDIYLKSRRDFKAAQPIYEQLASLHSEDQRIQATLLGIYRENQNFDGVRRVYENRLAQTGEDPTLRFQIAQTELQAGRGDVAVAYAEQHLSGNTATPFQLQMLSTVYDKAGRKDAALTTLDTAITRETNAQQRASMQFQKTDMLIWNKQYEDAERLLRSIIEAAGDDKQTASRAKSEIIRIYEIQGRVSELDI